jgi:hypothetical protein
MNAILHHAFKNNFSYWRNKNPGHRNYIFKTKKLLCLEEAFLKLF